MTTGVSGGGRPYAPQQASGSDGGVAKLEQQKKILQDEITRVKQDGKLAPEAKKKKLAELQRKLREVENAIQKAPAKPAGSSNETKISAAKAEQQAERALENTLEASKKEDKNPQAKLRKGKLGEYA